MGLDAGNDAIGKKYQQYRTNFDNLIANQQEKTETAKQEAFDEMAQAFKEIGKNDSDTLLGSIIEGANDTLYAIGKLGEATNTELIDELSDITTYYADKVHDYFSYQFEGTEKTNNTIGNFFSGIIAAGKQILYHM